MQNQIKMMNVGNGNFKKVEVLELSDNFEPIGVDIVSGTKVENIHKEFTVVDINDVRDSYREMKRWIKDDWFGGVNSTRVVTGVFWTAFITYIFPWLLDIAKVYCAFMICQAFYKEKSGKSDGKSGFQALVHYGKWYLAFWLIPWGVTLIDQIGSQMFDQLTGGNIPSPAFNGGNLDVGEN